MGDVRLARPDPVLVVDLFPFERQELLTLLASLAPEAWARPTIAGEWTVKDVAAHLVADDLGRISSGRDGHRVPWVPAEEPLKAFIDRRNAEWVTAMRRVSPRLLLTLLELGGRESHELFASIDPFALGAPVDWAGSQPAPNWLDLARELTERWHHQQQIREAVGAPPLDEPRLLRPVLATFAFSLPQAVRDLVSPIGTSIGLRIDGESGGDWTVVRDEAAWSLWTGRGDDPSAAVTIDQDTAWRMYVRALDRQEVERRSRVDGDAVLGSTLLGAFALVS